MTASKVRGEQPSVAKRFAALSKQWKLDRNEQSSDPSQWAMDLSYQRIIGLGPDVLPYLFQELNRRPDHWFWALHVLTGANPVKSSNRGHFKRMVNDWLSWGTDRGFLAPETQKPVPKPKRPKLSKNK